MHARPIVFISLILTFSTGCSTMYYSAWEKFGWAKRDILVDRVKDARDDQTEAKEQFKTTLEQFQAVTNFQGGNLESKYKKLNSEYEDSVAAATAVRERIASVEKVAADLFKEWQGELKEYESAELRRNSEKQLNETRERYRELIGVMKQAGSKMDPVLGAFKDQVLFLKHNLNAQAIASLQNTAAGIEQDVAALIKDMEASIAEANAFISEMGSGGKKT